MKSSEVNSQWQQDWAGILPGEPVQLSQGNDAAIAGVLDTRSDDCSVVWIHLNDGAGRRLIHHHDGYSLTPPGP